MRYPLSLSLRFQIRSSPFRARYHAKLMATPSLLQSPFPMLKSTSPVSRFRVLFVSRWRHATNPGVISFILVMIPYPFWGINLELQEMLAGGTMMEVYEGECQRIVFFFLVVFLKHDWAPKREGYVLKTILLQMLNFGNDVRLNASSQHLCI